MTLRFEQPMWLWLALLAVPLAAVALWTFQGMSTSRRWSAVLLRAALLASVATLLAGATVIRTSDRSSVIAVVDGSGSVRRLSEAPVSDATELSATRRAAEVWQRLPEWLAAASQFARPDDALGIVAFDAAATPVLAPSRAADVAPAEPGEQSAVRNRLQAFTQAAAPQSLSGTDIAAALRQAMTMLPPDANGRVVLVSDGLQTQGDAIAAARVLAADDAGTSGAGRPRVPIDVLPISYRLDREVMVDSVDLPATSPAGATVTARITLMSTHATTGRLRLTSEGEALDLTPGQPGSELPVTIAAGRTVVPVSIALGPGRVHRLTATFVPGNAADDGLSVNNSAAGVTLSPGAGAVLVVDGVSRGAEGGGGAVLVNTLRGQSLTVEAIAPESLPADLLKLERYDLIILQNVSADAVDENAQKALVRFVAEMGGGLAMVGGPDSFGAGGWKGSPLEDILPVKLDLPERLVVPQTALIIILDSSGSMRGSVAGSSRTQQEIANQGAALAVRSLDRTDLVGVIQFDSVADVVVPLGPHTDPEETARRIQNISSGGGTNLPPAMEMALEQMTAAQAKLKHVIILSDGESQGKSRVEALAGRFAAAGIKLSTISVGDQADDLMLQNVARLGGGTFYRVDNPMSLPRIFLRAVRVVRSPMIREEPFAPVPAGQSAIMRGIDVASMPPLNGLVLTQPREDVAQVQDPASGQPPVDGRPLTGGVSYGLLTPQGEPVLAHWQVGLGQVAAFTSDAHRWAEPWLAWPGHAQMWGQLARVIARPASARSGEITAQIEGGQLRLRFDAAQTTLPGTTAAPATQRLSVSASVYNQSGTRTDATLVQVAPGRYEGVASLGDSAEPGTFVTVVSARTPEGRPLPPVLGAVVRPAGDEYRSLASNDVLLREIARIAGGRVLSLDDAAGADLFGRQGLPPRQTRLPLWPYLIPITLLLLWLDVATRRVAWDRLISREFGSSLADTARAATADRSAAAASSVAGLKRSVEKPTVGQSLLGSNDADALARQARDRRRIAQAGGPAVQQARPQTSATPPDPTQTSQTAPSPDSAGGLLAAKRRAQERLKGP